MVVLPDGSLGSRYDKVRIVPFGEYLPLRSLFELVPGQPTNLVSRDAVAGTGPAVLDTPAGRFAELAAVSELLHATAQGDNAALAEPLRQRAAVLLERAVPSGC